MKITIQLSDDQKDQILIEQLKEIHAQLKHTPPFIQDDSLDDVRQAVRVLYRFHTGKKLK